MTFLLYHQKKGAKRVRRKPTITRTKKLLIIIRIISFILFIIGITLFLVAHSSLCIKKEGFIGVKGRMVNISNRSSKKCISRISIDDAPTETKVMYYLGISFMVQPLLVIAAYVILLWTKKLV